AAPGGPDAEHPGGRGPLRRLQSDERRLPAQPPGDGRGSSRRHAAPDPTWRARPGAQLRAQDYASAELPRSSAPPPLVPSGRAARVSGFTFRELTRSDAEEIARWKYPEPYSMYDGGDPDRLLEYTYFAGLDEEGGVVGFCCFGEDARVPGLDEEEGVL